MNYSTASYSSPKGDKNDCSVRAFARAAGISYDAAHKRFADHGRKRGCATQLITTALVLREAFPDARGVNMKDLPMSIAEFVDRLPRDGAYIVHTNRHAFAIVDGIVHDWDAHPHRIVKWYCKIPLVIKEHK